MKGLPILKCSECKFLKRTPYPTADPWERAEYWWCTHPNNELIKSHHEKDEELRKSVEKEFKSPTRYIAGYVEWHDKIKIPEWCPLPEIKE